MSYQHDNNFKVYARIRPYNQEQDNTNDGKYPFNYGADNITVELKNMDHTFTYDKVYEPETTQEEIFNTVGKKAINNAFEGNYLCYFIFRHQQHNFQLRPDMFRQDSYNCW